MRKNASVTTAPDNRTTRIETSVDTRFDDEITFLRALVATPSDNPPGNCAPIAEVAKTELERRGFNVEAHTVPSETVEAFGMIAATNLIVRRRFGNGPVIALNAHGDVVPPGSGWTFDPFAGEIQDGKMYGRGVAVSKSDFATYAFALLALEDIADDLSGTVELHLTFDEEIGGLIGPKWLLEQGLVKPDLCISAGFSYSIVTAHNGCLHLVTTIKGKSAHAAAPETGYDALEACNQILSALYAERKHYKDRVSATPGIGHPNMTVGLISGGINTNVVPDQVTIRIDRRMTPEEDPIDVEDHLRELIELAIDNLPGISVEFERVLQASPLKELPGSERLSNPIREHAERLLGVEVPTMGVPLYTDARLYSDVGIPTISYGAGPRTFLEANGHRADENLVVADLNAATKIVACALADILSTDG